MPLQDGETMMMRIAEMVIKYFEDFDAFCEWVERMHRAGVLEEVKIKRDQKLVAMKGVSGGGICRDMDPILAFVMLSKVFFGGLWPLMPGAKEAFEAVKKWWREKVRRMEPLHSEDKDREKKRPEKSLLDFVEGS